MSVGWNHWWQVLTGVEWPPAGDSRRSFGEQVGGGGGGCQISPLPFLLTHTYSDIICTFSTRLHRLSLYELGNFLKPIMIPALIARGRKHFSEIAYNSVFQKMHTSQQDTAIVTLTGRTWLGGGSCNFHLLVWENSQCSNYSVFLTGSPKSLFSSSSWFPWILYLLAYPILFIQLLPLNWLTVFCSSDYFPSILYLLAYHILFIWLLPLNTVSLGLPYSVHLTASPRYCISWLTMFCSSDCFPSVLYLLAYHILFI